MIVRRVFSHLALVFAVRLVAWSSAQVACRVPGVQRGELMKITRTLYGHSYVHPREVLAMLKKIRATKFDSFDAEGLIELDNITLNKCNGRSLEHFDEVVDGLELGGTIKSYVDDCKRRQVAYCRKTFNERLLEATKTFSPEELDDFKLLTGDMEVPHKIFQTIGIIKEVSNDRVRASAVDFLVAKEKQVKEAGRKFDYDEQLYEEIENSLLHTCRRVNEVLSSFLYLYRQVQFKRDLADEIVSWMQLAGTCDKLTHNSRLIFRVHQDWASRREHHAKTREFILI